MSNDTVGSAKSKESAREICARVGGGAGSSNHLGKKSSNDKGRKQKLQ